MADLNLELRTRAVGPWPMNSYALVCPATGASVLIDPGAEPDTLLAMLDGTTPTAILLTHTHPDHVGALDEMLSRLNVPLLAHTGPHYQGMQLPTSRTLTTGDTVAVGQATLHVYHTPGHIDDMICFAVDGDPTIIVGDTVFAGGPGKTWSADGFQTTLRVLREVVLAWPAESICYPGHGPAFRLGDKHAAIADFVNRQHAAGFFGDATW